MPNELPFTGIECHGCGFLSVTEAAHRAHRCYGDLDTMPVLVDQFLARWHWRGEASIVRAELLDLIAAAKGRG